MKILVIGGGMAGLTYAIVACKNGYDVTVAERNSRVGKKISMTGNGKCNIGNARVNADCFNRSGIADRVLNAVSVDEYVKFLNSCGIYVYTDSEGRMYPLSDSAANVVDCLRHQLSKYGGKLLVNSPISSVSKAGNKFEAIIGGNKSVFDKVVLACGSRSQAAPTGAESLLPEGVLTPTVPSLVPVKIRDMDAALNGLRARAEITLYDGKELLDSRQGELLFKDYGLSGICILDLSATIARREVERKGGDYIFVADVVPRMSQEVLEKIIGKRLDCGERDKLFYGILHNKLAEHIVRRAGASADASRIAHTAKNLSFKFDRLLDWSMSQVTAGGIAERYLDADALTLPNGVVALGEVLDVDGICGGNNLYFAAASALYVFDSAERDVAYTLS